jgi:hypothetical protein
MGENRTLAPQEPFQNRYVVGFERWTDIKTIRVDRPNVEDFRQRGEFLAAKHKIDNSTEVARNSIKAPNCH